MPGVVKSTEKKMVQNHFGLKGAHVLLGKQTNEKAFEGERLCLVYCCLQWCVCSSVGGLLHVITPSPRPDDRLGRAGALASWMWVYVAYTMSGQGLYILWMLHSVSYVPMSPAMRRVCLKRGLSPKQGLKERLPWADLSLTHSLKQRLSSQVLPVDMQHEQQRRLSGFALS